MISEAPPGPGTSSSSSSSTSSRQPQRPAAAAQRGAESSRGIPKRWRRPQRSRDDAESGLRGLTRRRPQPRWDWGWGASRWGPMGVRGDPDLAPRSTWRAGIKTRTEPAERPEVAGSGEPALGKGRGLRHLPQRPGCTLFGLRGETWECKRVYVEAREASTAAWDDGRGQCRERVGRGQRRSGWAGLEQGVWPAGACEGVRPLDRATARNGTSKLHRLVQWELSAPREWWRAHLYRRGATTSGRVLSYLQRVFS